MPPRKHKKEFGKACWPQWIELPEEITANILQRVGALEMLQSAQKVCTSWWRVCQDPATWRAIRIAADKDGDNKIPILTCRRAVDRSQGQLLDLSIQNFGDNDLLNYIVDRSSGLKRLTLQGCPYVLNGQGLVEAVRKLAHLEELHIVIMPSLQAADVINIGISCPKLKSFTLNHRGFLYPPEFDEILTFGEPNGNEFALAIANNMPNLCHLGLIASPMDHQGLEAILDGCPNLDTLDIRQCFDVNLQDDLRKKCCEQIKHIKFPFYEVSFEEYERAPIYQDDGYGSCSDVEYVEENRTYFFDDGDIF